MASTNTYQQPFVVDDELDASGGPKRKLKYSSSILRYSQYREAGHFKRIRRNSVKGLYSILRKKVFEENMFDTQNLDKIFCSQFLDSKHVIFGTKCNRLMILNTHTRRLLELCNLKSSPETKLPLSNPCGIHAIAINPSRTRLVTGAENPNDTAVFELPELLPSSVGDVGHSNWIFDIKWLDDRHYISSAKDSQLILWDAEGPDAVTCNSRYIRGFRNETFLKYTHTRPKHSVTAHAADVDIAIHGVRALEFNADRDELLTLTMAAEIQQWDARELLMVGKRHLTEHVSENVCLASNSDITAIGSKEMVSFVDNNNLDQIQAVPIMKYCSGVRSLSLRDYILTVGTGHSNVSFIDIRTYKYIEKEIVGCYDDGCDESRSFLNCSRSRNTEVNINDYENTCSAIFSHCYDPTGLRLFTAGGPLSATLTGCYASLWQ